jgi:23S rRNA (uridine2552-2'-O)-methyltransferase
MPAPYKRPDHFTKKAKAAGFEARSVFKLDELDQKHRLSRRGGRAIDLGCFPGSWSRYLINRGMHVIGVDLKAPAFPGTWIARSVMEVEPEELLAGGRVELLVSDMAPNTTGDRFTDHVRQVRLAERALFLARACLREGGAFVVKVFDGEDAPAFAKDLGTSFASVHRVKPDATRSRSVEFFLVVLGFRQGSLAPGSTHSAASQPVATKPDNGEVP